LVKFNYKAVPLFSADIKYKRDSSHWKKYHQFSNSNGEYDIIHNGAFSLTVHQMFRKKGNIDLFYPHKGFGFIKKNIVIFFLNKTGVK